MQNTHTACFDGPHTIDVWNQFLVSPPANDETGHQKKRRRRETKTQNKHASEDVCIPEDSPDGRKKAVPLMSCKGMRPISGIHRALKRIEGPDRFQVWTSFFSARLLF